MLSQENRKFKPSSVLALGRYSVLDTYKLQRAKFSVHILATSCLLSVITGLTLKTYCRAQGKLILWRKIGKSTRFYVNIANCICSIVRLFWHSSLPELKAFKIPCLWKIVEHSIKENNVFSGKILQKYRMIACSTTLASGLFLPFSR